MIKLEPWLECNITGKKEKINDPPNQYARILFRPQGDEDSVNYIEIEATEDGGLLVRTAEGVLSIRPQVANSVNIYKEPLS